MRTFSIVSLLENLPSMEEPVEIILALEKLIDAYKFDFYGLLIQPKTDENPFDLLLAGRWPEGWAQTYVKKKFVVIDPTIRYLGHCQSGFRWIEAMGAFQADPHRRRMEKMMMEAQKHGLHDGYIFPIHGRRGLLGNLSLGGRTVDLSSVERTLFDALAKTIFWRLISLMRPEISQELSSKVEVQMTRREMEALHYLAKGMTSQEISEVLKLSPHTVDWYMNGIQTKLKANNRHHAISIAFRLGLIS